MLTKPWTTRWTFLPSPSCLQHIYLLLISSQNRQEIPAQACQSHQAQHWSFFVAIATNLLCVPSRYDMAWISRNNSTHKLILAACQFLQAGVGAGSPAPRLGVDQRSSSSAEQLSDTEMGLAWKLLQHTLMTWIERVLKLLSPSFRFLPSFLTLKGNSERTQSHLLSKVSW